VVSGAFDILARAQRLPRHCHAAHGAACCLSEAFFTEPEFGAVCFQIPHIRLYHSFWFRPYRTYTLIIIDSSVRIIAVRRHQDCRDVEDIIKRTFAPADVSDDGPSGLIVYVGQKSECV
jgi:hypothetical protein